MTRHIIDPHTELARFTFYTSKGVTEALAKPVLSDARTQFPSTNTSMNKYEKVSRYKIHLVSVIFDTTADCVWECIKMVRAVWKRGADPHERTGSQTTD